MCLKFTHRGAEKDINLGGYSYTTWSAREVGVHEKTMINHEREGGRGYPK